jgi:uncharacterized protein YdeI (YjbR/CyaY-like superfamily)
VVYDGRKLGRLQSSDRKERSRTVAAPPKPTFFPSAAQFRDWLASEYHQNDELWVGFHKKSSLKPSITYPEAVDEALCFGWIDGVRKSVNDHAYMVRFTPRRANSRWSAVNIKRAQVLSATGRMHPAGVNAFRGAQEQPRAYSYEQRNQASFAAHEERELRSNRKAWDFFQSQPPWYRRTATFWVISAKREETRKKRLQTLIKDSENHRPIKPLTRSPVPKR